MTSRLLLALFFVVAMQGLAQTNTSFIELDRLIQSNENTKALEWIHSALRNSPDPSRSALLKNREAEILISGGQLNEAEQLLYALEKENHSDFIKAVTFSNIGNVLMRKGRYDLALESQLKALALLQKSGNENTREGAQCLASLAMIYTSTGKYNQAEDNGLIALQIRQKLFGEQSEEVAASYNDLGLVYTQTDPDRALEYYEKALPVYEALHGKNHPKIAIANANIGFIYRQLELYGDAANNFEDALAIWRSIYPNGHPNEAFVLSNLGQTYLKMGNLKASEEYFQKALTIYTKAYGEKHPDISSTMNQIGILKLRQSDYDGAIQNFHNAIGANILNQLPNDVLRSPKIDQYYNGYVLLYSMRLKAQALEARHSGKTLSPDDIRAALSCLYSCDSLIDNIRHHSPDESDKIALGEQAIEVYEDGVNVAYALSEMSWDAKKYREAAFYFAEKSKSAVLQESIADANAKSFAGIPDALLEEESNLKSTITLLSQKLSQKPAADEEKTLREALFKTSGQYNAFVKRLEKEFPNYFNLKYSSPSISLKDLQNKLTASQAIISYFLAEKNGRVFQFIITKKSFRVRNLTMPKEFDRIIKGFGNSLYYSALPTYNTSSQLLRKALIPKLPGAIKEITIIPTGKLSTLPFEALPYHAKTKKEFNDENYVANHFAVNYAFSSSLIGNANDGREQNPAIFLCAPIEFKSNETLNSLPGTEQEVNTIASLFTGSKTVAKNADANEELVKSGDLGKYNYLHFATHGIVDETNPELSRIFLNTKDREDGNLFSGEIYNLNLNANLTVLSACQTGLGKVSKGEGVIGLSRALIYAGSKSLVVSFWSVADESTAQLMMDFYRAHLHEKADLSRALQAAKKKMISEGKFSSPYYWAPFILIGN